jgi:hypothetical protein
MERTRLSANVVLFVFGLHQGRQRPRRNALHFLYTICEWVYRAVYILVIQL